MTDDPLKKRPERGNHSAEGDPRFGKIREADVTPDAEDRVRRAFLATKRDELLTPVRVINEFSGQILTLAADLEQPGFSDDMQKVDAAGRNFAALVDEILDPSKIQSAATDEESLLSRLRHEMLNELNPIINYSEMWIEDADEQFLSGFIPELQMILNAGKKCEKLVDQILASRDIDSARIPVEESSRDQLRDIFSPPEETETAVAAETGLVLIVDDDDINRDILSRQLQKQGHQVACASNGSEALRMLTQQAVDLMLLDIVMPEMNGVEVLARVKADDHLSEVPVIMISALDEMNVVARCIKLGAEDYMPKPFNPTVLKARVDRSLEKRRLRQREIEYLQEIEREKKRADELLHVILPTEIVTELKATNTVAPRRYDNVAVLFVDIVNFTPYCDQHSAEDVVNNLQQLIVTWEEIALRHGVQKVKTIGDAFMAACGLFGDCTEPVLNCIRCGLEMIDATHKLEIGWNVRVGINAGSVVGGVLGRRQYLFDIWGDTVNTAARMESHGIEGAIVLSTAAWRKIAQQCEGRPLESVSIKGKGIMERVLFDGFSEPEN